jgi:hypothetical protein
MKNDGPPAVIQSASLDGANKLKCKMPVAADEWKAGCERSDSKSKVAMCCLFVILSVFAGSWLAGQFASPATSAEQIAPHDDEIFIFLLPQAQELQPPYLISKSVRTEKKRSLPPTSRRASWA